MTYDDVYRLISRYCGDVLPQFADRWNRFPVCTAADDVSRRLQRCSDSWARVDAQIGAALAEAAETVRRHANAA